MPQLHKKFLILMILSSFIIGGFVGKATVYAHRETTKTIYQTEDPEGQCVDGANLFFEGNSEEAYPLLEAGFTNREQAIFENPEHLGYCAIVLGLLRDNAGYRLQALEAYEVALQVFRESGNREFEGHTLNNIGSVHRVTGSYAEALDAYELALTIYHELGMIESEANTLNGIAVIYQNRGNVQEALTVYQEVLALLEQTDDLDGKSTTYRNIAAAYRLLGDFPTSLDYFQLALDIHQESGDQLKIASTLDAMGTVYEALGQYDDAIESHLRALNTQQELGDRVGEMSTLNNLGAVFFSQGRFDEALQSFDKALKIYRETGDKDGEAIALGNVGAVYEARGLVVESIEFFSRALAIYQEVGNRRGEANTLNSFGSIYETLGDYTRAEQLIRQAYDINVDINDRSGQANNLNGLGVVYEAQSQYYEALNFYDQALTIQIQIGDRANEANTLDNIGAVYEALSQNQEAERYFKQSLAIRQEIGDRAGIVSVQSGLGSLRLSEGQFRAAREHYEHALEIARSMGARLDEGEALNNIGLVFSSLGDYATAENYFNEALELHQLTGNLEAESGTWHNLIDIYRHQGKLTEASNAAQSALVIARETGDRKAEGLYLRGLGSVYKTQGKVEDSLEAYSEALNIAREINDRMGEGDSLKNIGEIEKDLGQYDQALKSLILSREIAQELGNQVGESQTQQILGDLFLVQGQNARALEQYETALKILDLIRLTAGSEQNRFDFIAQYAQLFDRTMSLLLAMDQTSDAFAISERTRARSFLDSLATGFVQLDDQELMQLIEQENQLFLKRATLQDAVIKALIEDPVDSSKVQNQQNLLAEAQSEYNSLVKTIASRDEKLTQLFTASGSDYILEVTDLQSLLPEDATLVSYYLYKDFDNREQAIAFVITQDEFQAVPLPTGSTDISNANKLFRTFPDDPHTPSLVRLYESLIVPIEDLIETSKLIIIPHGVLHYIPFAALSNGKTYLGEQYVISTLPSASVLPLLSASNTNTSLLALGNPTTLSEELSNLPFAELEAERIANLFSTNYYLREEATESLVYQNASDTGYLHIAAHADFRPETPLQSALYLTPDLDHDGMLHVDEMYGLDLSATNLVVLSACETQTGEVFAGDDVVAMNRALLFAGAPTVVGSLWRVEDEATAILMSHFYEYLDTGWGKAEALRQAQLDLRLENVQYDNPYYWAGFVLTGDAGEVHNTELTAPQTNSINPTRGVTKLDSEPTSTAPDATAETTQQAPGPMGFCPAFAIALIVGLWSINRKSNT